MIIRDYMTFEISDCPRSFGFVVQLLISPTMTLSRMQREQMKSYLYATRSFIFRSIKICLLGISSLTTVTNFGFGVHADHRKGDTI